MKYISTLIIFILFSFISTAQNSKINPILIIGESIKIGNLEVAQNVFPKQMNWGDAKRACKRLGSGWRLPTKDELTIMYQNKDKIGGFATSVYWSSTESGINFAWLQDFGLGGQLSFYKGNTLYVRAIRTF
jgi:hypothetical protein